MNFPHLLEIYEIYRDRAQHFCSGSQKTSPYEEPLLAKIIMKDKIFNLLEAVFPIIFLISFVLYKITKLSIFLWMAFICALPLIIPIAAIIIFAFGNFIIFCFQSLLPGRKNKSFMFIDEELPWWAAIICLCAIFTFLYTTIPIFIHNIGLKLDFIDGNLQTLYSTIDTDTIWGLFQEWVVGERTIKNSIVSWSIVFIVGGSLYGIGWLVQYISNFIKTKKD